MCARSGANSLEILKRLLVLIDGFQEQFVTDDRGGFSIPTEKHIL
jgi:hypothetical protein